MWPVTLAVLSATPTSVSSVSRSVCDHLLHLSVGVLLATPASVSSVSGSVCDHLLHLSVGVLLATPASVSLVSGFVCFCPSSAIFYICQFGECGCSRSVTPSVSLVSVSGCNQLFLHLSAR